MGKLGDLVRRGVGAPVRALLPRNPWLRLLVFAIPVLILAAFLEPVLSLLTRGMDLVLRTFTPLLDNPLGRLILLNVLLLIGLIVCWYTLRDRFRNMRSGTLLRHHLDGVNALVAEPARARELFRKVAASKAQPPNQYPAAVADAQIKLARLDLEAGNYDSALAWLTRVREKGLPRELRRSLLQLRAEAAVAHGQVLPESLEADLRAGLKRFPDDGVLLAQLRRALLDRGELEEAAALQEKIAGKAPPGRRDPEQQRLLDDLLVAGEAALGRGDLKLALRLARKAQSVLPDPRSGCLIGKVRLAEGSLKAAVKEWGATRSPEGLELMAELLDRNPGVLGPRELLECSATEGTLLLVAREYARAGDHDRALRAARRAARSLGPLPSVTAILSEVLTLCGQPDEAAQIQDEAVLRLLAAPGPGS